MRQLELMLRNAAVLALLLLAALMLRAGQRDHTPWLGALYCLGVAGFVAASVAPTSAVEESLELDLSLADAVCFAPMDFGNANFTIGKTNVGHTFFSDGDPDQTVYEAASTQQSPENPDCELCANDLARSNTVARAIAHIPKNAL